MAISTNQKPTIYSNLYENTDQLSSHIFAKQNIFITLRF